MAAKMSGIAPGRKRIQAFASSIFNVSLVSFTRSVVLPAVALFAQVRDPGRSYRVQPASKASRLAPVVVTPSIVDRINNSAN
jgi:hypothetical protein